MKYAEKKFPTRQDMRLEIGRLAAEVEKLKNRIIGYAGCMERAKKAEANLAIANQTVFDMGTAHDTLRIDVERLEQDNNIYRDRNADLEKCVKAISQIHTICSDARIATGHVVDRVRVLASGKCSG